MSKELILKSIEQGDLKKALSYEEIQQNIYCALDNKEATIFYYAWYWIYRTFNDNVIVQFGNSGENKMYRVLFNIDEQDNMLITGYEEVKMTFMPVGELISLTDMVSMNKSKAVTLSKSNQIDLLIENVKNLHPELLKKDCKKELKKEEEKEVKEENEELKKLFDASLELLEIK